MQKQNSIDKIAELREKYRKGAYYGIAEQQELLRLSRGLREEEGVPIKEAYNWARKGRGVPARTFTLQSGTGAIQVGTCAELALAIGVSVTTTRRIVRGVQHQSKGWFLSVEKNNIPFQHKVQRVLTQATAEGKSDLAIATQLTALCLEVMW